MSLSLLILDILRQRPGMTQAELRDAVLAQRALSRYALASALGQLVRRGRVFQDGAGDARRFFAVSEAGGASQSDPAALALALIGFRDRTAADIAEVLRLTAAAAQIVLDGLMRDRSVERYANADGVYVYKRAAPPAGPRMTPDEFAAVEKFMALTDAELGGSLPGAIRLELIALEDVLQQACKVKAPHTAIREIAGAQAALRKAMEALSPPALAA